MGPVQRCLYETLEQATPKRTAVSRTVRQTELCTTDPIEHSPQRACRTINTTRESQQPDSSLSHRYDTGGKVRDVTSSEPQSASTAEAKCNQPSALESQADCTLKLRCLPNKPHLMAKHCISIRNSFSTPKRPHRLQVTVAEDAASRRLLCSEAAVKNAGN